VPRFLGRGGEGPMNPGNWNHSSVGKDVQTLQSIKLL
jgi:hypothetical protein